MQNLKLIEILLVSHREKRARKVKFHPDVTVIRGANDTGKSSLIKSIYYTFGAEPPKIHSNWKDASVSSLVRFSVNGTNFSLYRQAKSFSLFSANDTLIGTYDRVTNGLGPKLANIFDFNLILASRDGKHITAPPAFLFLPFYIDQDRGWTDIFNSFDHLSQFTRWKNDVKKFHSGILPNKWYELKSTKKLLLQNKEVPLQRERVLKEVIERTEKKFLKGSFDIDIDAYKKEIDNLLLNCELLKKKEEEYKEALVDLETDRIRLQAQKEIVVYAHNELSLDYSFANSIEEDHVECPTCGETYSNKFAERFNIAFDEDRCFNLLQNIQKRSRKLESETKLCRNEFKETGKELKSIEKLLATKQGSITLKDLIQNEGRREVSKTLHSDISKIQEEISYMDTQLRDIENELKKYQDRVLLDEINQEYNNRMRKYTSLLGVTTLPSSAFKNVTMSIDDTGSDQPRAILAYYFSLLHVIRKFGSSTFCPIILDSLNQQEQDNANLLKMLKLIKNHRPEDSQLILGLVDDCNIDFGGKVVEMTKKYSALSEDEYKRVSAEIEPYSNANLGL